MNQRAQTTLYERERKWFFAALALVLVTVSLYMYFLSASVVHVVMRKEVDKEIASLSSDVGALEASYIEAQHSVSEDIASLKGYKKTEDKIFIDRTAGTLSLKN